MTAVTVTTQTELDTALADPKITDIDIRSPKGVWLYLSASGSASVSASGSASVIASGSASVIASGSASVSASGSASVIAFGSASVSASGSASVIAFGSASVIASGSASVRATKYVAVHLHSVKATVTGGVLIDVSNLDFTDPQVRHDYYGEPLPETAA